MSRRVVKYAKEPTEDVDTAPEVQGGWRISNAGEVGIHARGICGVHRKTFVIFYRFFLQEFTKKFFNTKFTDVRSWVIVHIPPRISTSCTGIVIM